MNSNENSKIKHNTSSLKIVELEDDSDDKEEYNNLGIVELEDSSEDGEIESKNIQNVELEDNKNNMQIVELNDKKVKIPSVFNKQASQSKNRRVNVSNVFATGNVNIIICQNLFIGGIISNVGSK